MSMQPKRTCHLFAAALFVLAAAVTSAADDFPGGNTNRQIIKIQEKVDALFDKGDYERAYFICREELVPIGDKYAQYMVGYMTLVGKGVPRDLITGSAWYRLAAERGDKAFTQARDELLRQFDAEKLRQSEHRYFELRREYSDAMIVANLIEKDLDGLSGNFEASNWARQLNPGQNAGKETISKENAKTIARVENFLEYLERASNTPDFLTQEESQRITAIQRRATDLLQLYRSQN